MMNSEYIAEEYFDLIKYVGKFFIQYHIVGIVNQTIVPILIDTGAACSIIDKQLAYKTEYLEYPTKIQSIAGIYHITESADYKVILHDKLVFKIKCLAEDNPANKCILGTDFLNCVKSYTITDDYIEINGIQIGRTKIAFNKIEELILATKN